MPIISFATVQNNNAAYADATALTAVDTTLYMNGSLAGVTDLGVFQLNMDSTATPDAATILAATPKGNWLLVSGAQWLFTHANGEIDGSQIGAFSSVALANGTAAAPSLSFTSDTNTGIYRVGADDLGISTGGTLRFDVSTTAVTSTLPVVHPVGAAATPAVTFTGDLNTGLYWIGADDLGVSVGGTLRLDVSTSAVTSTLPVVLPVGAAATPALTFTGDTNTGLYWVGADNLGVSVGGTLRLDITTTNVTSTLPLLAPSGSAAAPALRVTSEATGLYLVGAGSLGVSIAGVIKANITATALNMASGVALQIATVQVVGARNTGWTTFVGTGTKNQGAIDVDTFTASDANIRLLGQGVKGILDALISHGLLGA